VSTALQEAELVLLQGAANEEDGSVRVMTQLLHGPSAEWVRTSLAFRPARVDPQGVGSALTYGRRYTLQALLGLAAEDDDGNEASRDHGPSQSQMQAKVTWNRQREEVARSEGTKFVEPKPGYTRPSAKESVEPGLKEDKERIEHEDKAATPLQSAVKQEIEKNLKRLEGVPSFSKELSDEYPSDEPPDDLEMGPAPAEDPESWKNHKIKGIAKLLDRTVESLTSSEMSRIENVWIPAAKLKGMSDLQAKDLAALEARIENDKLARPW
jgi:hypothetical protein